MPTSAPAMAFPLAPTSPAAGRSWRRAASRSQSRARSPAGPPPRQRLLSATSTSAIRRSHGTSRSTMSVPLVPRCAARSKRTSNGANITDARLSGSGVTAGNFGPLAPGAATGALSVTFDGTERGGADRPGRPPGQQFRQRHRPNDLAHRRGVSLGAADRALTGAGQLRQFPRRATRHRRRRCR